MGGDERNAQTEDVREFIELTSHLGTPEVERRFGIRTSTYDRWQGLVEEDQPVKVNRENRDRVRRALDQLRATTARDDFARGVLHAVARVEEELNRLKSAVAATSGASDASRETAVRGHTAGTRPEMGKERTDG